MIAAIKAIWAQLIESWDVMNFPPAVIYSLSMTYTDLNTSGADCINVKYISIKEVAALYPL